MEEISRCLPLGLRNRHHRLNIHFAGRESGLDEVDAIDGLEQQASGFIASSYEAGLLLSSIISLIFYFELKSWYTQYQGYICSGIICCRLPLEYAARKRLYLTLAEKKAFSLVVGRTVPRVQSIP